MKPADLYLTSRHIFGFLIPGMVWSLALRYFLHAFGVRAASILPDCFPLSKFGVVAAVFLFCSYLAGMLLQALSFGTAEFVENRWLRNYFVRKRDSGGTSLGELELAAHKLLEQNYPLVAAHLPMPADDGFRMATFLACKKTILARSAELSRSLLESEDDINLYGMLVLPLLFLTTGVLVNSILKPGTVMPSVTSKVVIVVFLLVLEPYLLAQFRIRRSDEQRDCYSTFLLLESSILRQSPT